MYEEMLILEGQTASIVWPLFSAQAKIPPPPLINRIKYWTPLPLPISILPPSPTPFLYVINNPNNPERFHSIMEFSNEFIPDCKEQIK